MASSLFVTLSLAHVTSFTSLFAALIAVNGTSRDNGPAGDGKTTCGKDKEALE